MDGSDPMDEKSLNSGSCTKTAPRYKQSSCSGTSPLLSEIDMQTSDER